MKFTDIKMLKISGQNHVFDNIVNIKHILIVR